MSSSREPTSVCPSVNTLGHVHSVETCGTVDGPGLRYVLFASGCPLKCQYCHNPDAQGKPCGEVRSAADVLADLKKYRNFIRSGGLTISGGEPLMQSEFAHAIFQGAKEMGIHTALDTSGFLGVKAGDEMLESIDLVLLDIKSWIPKVYRETTGVMIDPTIRFAKRLNALGKPTWIRFVLVPGLTNGEENIEGLASFISTLRNVERVEILPFHKMGESKYEELGMDYKLAATPVPNAKEMLRAKRIFRKYGVEAI
ncbi:MAG: pyruvate formate-lyase-activating protein [Verrucomicrobiota bacterium]